MVVESRRHTYLQVSALLRRILPEVPPPVLATILGVPGLPPSEYGVPPATPDGDTAGATELGGAGASPLDMHRAGLLDVLLACVAKALTVQAKAKGGRGAATTLATSIHPRDPLGARWWLRGSVSRKLAQGIVALLRDMAAVSDDCHDCCCLLGLPSEFVCLSLAS